MSPKRPTPASPQIDPAYAALGVSWRRALLAQHRSPHTIATYLMAQRLFGEFLARQPEPLATTPLHALKREHVEAWIVDLFARGYRPRSVINRFGGLHAWFAWLEEEEEIAQSPMRHMRTPRAPEEHRAVLTDAQVRALLATCSGGKTFAERRDLALLMLLFDTGMRRGELASITLDHLNLDEQCVIVTAKGGNDRIIAFGRQTVRALDRYLRMRAAHAHAQDGHLFVGQLGAMQGVGVYWVLRRRAAQAGLTGIHPHLFRHTYAHLFLEAGGQESDLMAQAGWKTAQMVRHYGATLRGQRAREAAKRLSPADRMANGG